MSGATRRSRWRICASFISPWACAPPALSCRAATRFSSLSDQELSAIAATIEDAIQDTFGFEVKVILRRAQEFRAIFEYQLPSTKRNSSEASKLAIVYLAQLPAADALSNLKKSISGPEVIRAHGKELFIYLPGWYGEIETDQPIH